VPLGAEVPSEDRVAAALSPPVVPSLALTEDALRLMAPFEGKDLTGTARVTWSALKWIWIDLMPEWSRRIYRYPEPLARVAQWPGLRPASVPA
jgi:hypothetical protein